MAFSSCLFSVAVTLRQEGASFVLRYTDLARAREAYALFKIPPGNRAAAATDLVVEHRDDFGTEVSVDRRDIMLVLHEDLGRALEVNGTVELMKVRANVYLQQAAKSDPLLNGSIVMPSGPGPGANRPQRQ